MVQQTPVSDQNVAIPVSGFLTPPAGQVRTRVGVVAYEGDLGLVGDSLRLNTTPLTNSLNPSTNFFNSSLTGFDTTNTTGDPFQTNMLGFDIDTINANDVLANSASSATINLNTNNDTYFPGVVSFSTELFAPRLDVAKSALDLNGGTWMSGDEILYTVRIINDGEDGASSGGTDLIPEGATYVAGSLEIDGQPVTDTAGDDAGELASGPPRVMARLGTGATATSGGTMPIGATGSVSFGVTVDEVLATTCSPTSPCLLPRRHLGTAARRRLQRCGSDSALPFGPLASQDRADRTGHGARDGRLPVGRGQPGTRGRTGGGCQRHSSCWSCRQRGHGQPGFMHCGRCWRQRRLRPREPWNRFHRDHRRLGGGHVGFRNRHQRRIGRRFQPRSAAGQQHRPAPPWR